MTFWAREHSSAWFPQSLLWISCITFHEKCTEGGTRVLWQFGSRRSCKISVVLGVLVFISYIFIFSNTICNKITTLRFVVGLLLFFLCIFLFLLDFWFLLGLGNLNRSRRYNFVTYIKAPCIHFFQWTINKSIYFQLSLIRISQSSSLLVVRCPIRLNYWWEAIIDLFISIPSLSPFKFFPLK